MADANGLAGGGLATALRLLGVTADKPGAASQDDLFEAPAPLPLPAAKGASGPKGGRPLNARNRSTDEWVRFFLSQNRAPLSVMGNVLSLTVAELTEHLQAIADKSKIWRETKDGGYWERVVIDPLAVLKLQQQVAAEAAKYVHKQQPRALEVEQRQRGVMILGDLTEATGEASDDDLALPLPPLDKSKG